MRKAAIISALLHVSVFAFAWFGLPSLFRDDPLRDQMVQVEMVMLEEPPKPEAKPEPPKPKPAPKPKPVAAPPPPPPPPEPPPVPEPPKLAEVAPEPPPEPEPVPAPKEEPKPRPEPKPKPKAEPKPEPKPVAKAPPKPAPKPKPKPKPAPPDQFQNILKNLAREKAELEKAEPRERKKDQVAAVQPNPEASRAANIDSARASAQLASLVKQQVTPCWNIPGGAKDAQKMQIAVRIQLNPDGTLRGPPRIEDAARMNADPFFRAMAESAARALRLPSCTPLRLPYAQYDLWKDITLIFDPSEALGP